MEIVSPPAVIIETVTDLDVGFSDVDVKTYTLYAVDSFVETPDAIVVQWGMGTVTLYRRHIRWYSTRQRTITRPVKVPITTAGSA
jgi:hypothetical protein